MPARLLVCVALAMVAAACGSSTKWPDCPTSTGVSCSPFPEGTYCPGVSPICIGCGAGMYTFVPSICDCTAGTWVCFAYADTVCAAGGAVYADPSCTEPYVNVEGDATTDGGATDTKGTGDGGCDLGHTPVCCGLGLTPMFDYSCQRDFGAAVCSANGWTCPNGGSLATACSTICIAIDAGDGG
jgi:hypothetical protein